MEIELTIIRIDSTFLQYSYEYCAAVEMVYQLESEQERAYRQKQEAIRAAEIKAQQERARKLREMYGILTKEHKKVDGEL